VFDSEENRDLFIVSASGDSVSPFFSSPSSEELAPSWSPDSTRIAFASNAANGNYNIFIGTVDRDSLSVITSATSEEGDPAWSPDGTRLAYRSTELYFDRNIWVIDLRDSTRLVIAPQVGDDIRPTWSPDGNFLAWASDRSGNREIWAIDLSVPEEAVPVQITLNAANDTAPAWSPDGETIAFTSDRSGNFDIWLATDLDSVLSASGAGAKRHR
jgi:Tol biopolymer transport system component